MSISINKPPVAALTNHFVTDRLGRRGISTDSYVDGDLVWLEYRLVQLGNAGYFEIALTPETNSWEWKNDNIVITFTEPIGGAVLPPMTITDVRRHIVEDL